jgi:importin subunit alpha-1
LKLASNEIYSPDLETQYRAIVIFRKKLSKEKNPPIQEVLQYGVTSRFVELLVGPPALPENPDAQKLIESIQFEAAWALTNIASGTPEQTLHVVQLNTVPVFIRHLHHPNYDIRDQCIWALGNIAGDGPQFRDLLLSHHVMSPLLENIDTELRSPNPRIQMVRNATWALSNLCRGRPAPGWNEVVVALPILAQLITTTDPEILSDACWSLSYLSDCPAGDSSRLDDVLSVNILPALINLLATGKTNIQTPALRTLGNIVTGNEIQTQAVIDGGALPAFKGLLSDPRIPIQKEACWAISNITAGTVDQVQSVIDHDTFPQLIQLLAYADSKVKREACWAVSNATSYHAERPDQIRYLVNQNCIPPLCKILREHDHRSIIVALGGLHNILLVGEQDAIVNPDGVNPYALLMEECGGLDTLEELQRHPNHKVYEEAKSLVDQFFAGPDEDEFDLLDGGSVEEEAQGFAYQTPSGGFSF